MLKYIKLDDIDVPQIKLRGICKDDPDYADLLLSIQKHGVLTPIHVYALPDGRYSLVNGLQRYSCAKLCEHDVIPASIDEEIQDDTDALLKSILTNLHQVKTKPFQYANALRLFIKRRDDMDLETLADLLGKSTEWVCDRLSLTNLDDEIGQMLDQRKLPVRKGQALAMLPKPEQKVILEKAGDMKASEFYDFCLERKRADQLLADADNKVPEPKSFECTPVLRTRVVICDELTTLTAGERLCESEEQLKGWRSAIAWVIQMDPSSKEAREQEWRERTEKQRNRHIKIDKELT